MSLLEVEGLDVFHGDLQAIFTLAFSVAEREVVALSGSRRTESAWVKTRVFDGAGTVVATMLLNMATLKESYAPYEDEHRVLYGARP